MFSISVTSMNSETEVSGTSHRSTHPWCRLQTTTLDYRVQITNTLTVKLTNIHSHQMHWGDAMAPSSTTRNMPQSASIYHITLHILAYLCKTQDNTCHCVVSQCNAMHLMWTNYHISQMTADVFYSIRCTSPDAVQSAELQPAGWWSMHCAFKMHCASTMDRMDAQCSSQFHCHWHYKDEQYEESENHCTCIRPMTRKGTVTMCLGSGADEWWAPVSSAAMTCGPRVTTDVQCYRCTYMQALGHCRCLEPRHGHEKRRKFHSDQMQCILKCHAILHADVCAAHFCSVLHGSLQHSNATHVAMHLVQIHQCAAP